MTPEPLNAAGSADNLPAHLTTLDELKQVTERYSNTSQSSKMVTHITIVNQADALGHFHPSICQLTNLVNLNLAGNAVTYIPSEISSLINLEVLNMSRNSLGYLNRHIGEVPNLLELDVGRNNLTKLPDELCCLTKLKVLNVYGNQLTELPKDFGQLAALKRLGLKGNHLVQLPSSFSSLGNLVELFITDNRLEELPGGLSNLSSLVKLQASFNSFAQLPADLFLLPRLEMARFAVCRIASLPPRLMDGCAGRLAWCSLGGNPVCADMPAPRADVAVLPGAAAATEGAEKLGDGASGEVFKSTWDGKPVAVKVFRSDVSPDGRTQEEVALACFVEHPNIARVVALQQQPQALLMDVVHGQPLADKPVFEPLLRCRWKSGSSWEARQVLQIAMDVASALAYLHHHHLCHGDVYAHNVLVDGQGRATMVDLGAAFCYPAGEGFWEAMEVRAFGLLLTDLVERIAAGGEGEVGAALAQGLAELAHHCTEEAPHARKGFADIVEGLQGMGR